MSQKQVMLHICLGLTVKVKISFQTCNGTRLCSACRFGQWQLPVLEEDLQNQTELRQQNNKSRHRNFSCRSQTVGEVSCQALLHPAENRVKVSSCAFHPKVSPPSSAQTNPYLSTRLLWQRVYSALGQKAGCQHQTKGREYWCIISLCASPPNPFIFSQPFMIQYWSFVKKSLSHLRTQTTW